MEKLAKIFVTEKCVISGYNIEFYKYSLPIQCDFVRRHNVVKVKSPESEDYQRRDDNLSRTRQTVRRIVWCNCCNCRLYFSILRNSHDTCLHLLSISWHEYGARGTCRTSTCSSGNDFFFGNFTFSHGIIR